MVETTYYRTKLSELGVSPVSNYQGDPGVIKTLQTLVNASGSGVVDDSGPLLSIPGAPSPRVVTDAPAPVNTAAIAPGEPGPGSGTSSGLSLQGAVQWVKDNPGKAIILGGLAFLVIREIVKKK